jgi:hypothetical protein
MIRLFKSLNTVKRRPPCCAKPQPHIHDPPSAFRIDPPVEVYQRSHTLSVTASTIDSPILTTMQGLRIAVEGCGHGTLHAIYASVAKSCELKGWPSVDLLIIGGDFQVCNPPQLLTMLNKQGRAQCV